MSQFKIKSVLSEFLLSSLQSVEKRRVESKRKSKLSRLHARSPSSKDE